MRITITVDKDSRNMSVMSKIARLIKKETRHFMKAYESDVNIPQTYYEAVVGKYIPQTYYKAVVSLWNILPSRWLRYFACASVYFTSRFIESERGMHEYAIANLGVSERNKYIWYIFLFFRMSSTQQVPLFVLGRYAQYIFCRYLVLQSTL